MHVSTRENNVSHASMNTKNKSAKRELTWIWYIICYILVVRLHAWIRYGNFCPMHNVTQKLISYFYRVLNTFILSYTHSVTNVDYYFWILCFWYDCKCALNIKVLQFSWFCFIYFFLFSLCSTANLIMKVMQL